MESMREIKEKGQKYLAMLIYGCMHILTFEPNIISSISVSRKRQMSIINKSVNLCNILKIFGIFNACYNAQLIL